MAPKKNFDTSNPERGLRLEKELRKLFPECRSMTALSDALSESMERTKTGRTIQEWIKSGASIDSEALARIAELGGDIVYILTGKRSQPAEAARNDDPRVDIAKLKQLLLDIERRIGEAE